MSDPFNDPFDTLDLRCVRMDAELEERYQMEQKETHGCNMNCRHDWASYHCRSCDQFDWSVEPKKFCAYCNYQEGSEHCNNCTHYEPTVSNNKFDPSNPDPDVRYNEWERQDELAAIDDYNNQGGY